MSEGFSGTVAPVAVNGGNGHGSEEASRPVPLHPAPAASKPDTEETSQPVETKPLAERLRALQHTAARH
jgi:hypothetical protein